MTTVQDTDTHHESVDITRPSRRPRVLMVVANPATSSTTGWPVGFWAAELFHPLYEFTKVRYRVTVASPDGGRVEIDALSHPRDESRRSSDDLISMGALNTPEIARLLERTPKLAELDLHDYDALVVCGDQAPCSSSATTKTSSARSPPSTRPRSRPHSSATGSAHYRTSSSPTAPALPSRP